MTDYMKETERLLDDVVRAATMTDCHGVQADIVYCESRAALLAHIQRGAVPEGERAAFESWIENEAGAGAARRWLNTEAYEDGRVQDYRTGWIACLEWLAAPAPDHFRDTAKMVPAPAEVPMPEPDYRGPAEAGDYFSGYTHTTMRTYGAACRAAGDAAGYERGMKEAGERIRRGREILDAALRGEVKP